MLVSLYTSYFKCTSAIIFRGFILLRSRDCLHSCVCMEINIKYKIVHEHEHFLLKTWLHEIQSKILKNRMLQWAIRIQSVEKLCFPQKHFNLRKFYTGLHTLQKCYKVNLLSYYLATGVQLTSIVIWCLFHLRLTNDGQSLIAQHIFV